MIRVSDLSGAWLDYWVARAEGIAADQLEVRMIQRSTDLHCVRMLPRDMACVLNYSASWSLAGPIIERELIELTNDRNWREDGQFGRDWEANHPGFGYLGGDTPLIAAMRAFVASKFGEEVPEVTP